MNELTSFIKPELLILIPVLYIVGTGLKKSKVKDEKIPVILGMCGIILAVLYVCGVEGLSLIGIFVSITQGILCAGLSVYCNQMYKQSNK